MKVLISLILLALFTAGCSIDIQNTDLVKPVVTNPYPLSVKYSGGANEVSGSTVDAAFSIGLKDRQLSGSTVKAEVSISTNRPSL